MDLYSKVHRCNCFNMIEMSCGLCLKKTFSYRKVPELVICFNIVPYILKCHILLFWLEDGFIIQKVPEFVICTNTVPLYSIMSSLAIVASNRFVIQLSARSCYLFNMVPCTVQ